MQVSNFLDNISDLGISNIVGVPDSLLKSLCDYLQQDKSARYHHYVGANEGACVGLAAGIYLGSKEPVCVYMQNSGIGNTVNPVASLIHRDVYEIPMLFVIGYRGEPGVKDEPQHVFQGKITISLMDVMDIHYKIINKNTSEQELNKVFDEASSTLNMNHPFAIIIEKDTFDAVPSFNNQNKYTLVREDAIKTILNNIDRKDIVVSTTGKISREVYESSDELFNDHQQAFLTVGSMGHASMIATGLAIKKPRKNVYCLDGDGAALMHLGSLSCIASMQPNNLIHIILNNHAHESVGGMPTCNMDISFAKVSNALDYPHSYTACNESELIKALTDAKKTNQLCLIEVFVKNGARSDLGRPKESPIENKEQFMRYHTQQGE